MTWFLYSQIRKAFKLPVNLNLVFLPVVKKDLAAKKDADGTRRFFFLGL